MKFLRRLFLIFTVMACPSLACGQALADRLPLSDGTLEGALPNGLRYVVKHNPYPAAKIEFRVVLNVGSVLENDSQKGMSHFLEHMIFNGSRNFPADSVIRVLKTMGIKYGYDLNAFTDYDKTIYILPVPTDEPRYTDIALEIMHDWVTSLNLYQADIEKEQKIVAQEIRDAIPHDIFHDTKLAGSRYLDRFVLGTEESIAAIDSTALRRYYDDWYRPDLITIIAVGDLDPADMESRIARTFGGMETRSTHPPVRTHYSLPTRGKTVWQQEADSLMRDNRLDIIFPVADIRSTTYADQRALLRESLFRNLLSERLTADPELKARYSRDWYLSDVAHKAFELTASTDNDMRDHARMLGEKLAQIKRYGFGADEVRDVKAAMIARLSKKDFDRTSQSICNDFIDLAVTGDRHMPNSARFRFWSEAAESVTPAELTKMADVFFDRKQQIVMCYQHKPSASSVKDEKTFLEAFRAGLKSKPGRYVYAPKVADEDEDDTDTDTAKFTVGELAEAEVADERSYDEIGLTELILSNGLRLALKPTPMAESGDVMVSMFGRGGFSSLPEGELPYYQGTGAYIDMGGVAGLSNEEMMSVAYGNEISVSFNIDNYFHEMYGVAFEGDVEELMKYIYLRITSSEKDRESFEEDIQNSVDAIDQEESWLLKQLQYDPFRVLQHKVADISGTINTDARELKSVEDIKRQDLDAMFAFYETLFGNPGSLTAVITGKFDPDTTRDIAVKYLGALPVRNEAPGVRPVGKDFPQGVYRDSIPSPDMPRSYVCVLPNGSYEHSLKNTLLFKMMRDVLQTRIIASLREAEGLVYSPYVTVTYRAYPDPAYYFDINYFCDASNAPRLEKLLFREIEKLQRDGIPESELAGIKQSFRIAKREQLDEGNTPAWRNKLKEMYIECGSIEEFAQYDTTLRNITTDDIRQAFNEFISPEQYSVISIVDQK